MVFVLSSIGFEDIVDCLVSSLDVPLTLWVKSCPKGMLDLESLVDRCDDLVDKLGTSVGAKNRRKPTDVEEHVFDEELCPGLGVVLDHRLYPTIS